MLSWKPGQQIRKNPIGQDETGTHVDLVRRGRILVRDCACVDARHTTNKDTTTCNYFNRWSPLWRTLNTKYMTVTTHTDASPITASQLSRSGPRSSLACLAMCIPSGSRGEPSTRLWSLASSPCLIATETFSNCCLCSLPLARDQYTSVRRALKSEAGGYRSRAMRNQCRLGLLTMLKSDASTSTATA